MTLPHVSLVKKVSENTEQAKEPKTACTSTDDVPERSQQRFPCVDSVVGDIDAKWQKRGLVA